jgi:hypothetical protein
MEWKIGEEMYQKNRAKPPRGHNFLYVPTDKSDHQLKLIGRIIIQVE